MVPFLKWAGGKRWLFTDAFIAKLPVYERYVEPFLGGGAGFFALQPKSALLSDVNEELINLYVQVREHPAEIERGLQELQESHSSPFYYEMRTRRPDCPIGKALRTLYLNRSCWNGLYRLNLRGEFNVPIGSKQNIVLGSDDFSSISKLL